MQPKTIVRAAAATAAAPLLLAALGACSGSGGSGGGAKFSPVNTKYAVAFNTTIRIQERWLAFLADEASSGGTDLNMDGDTIDAVAVVVNMASKKETLLPAMAGLLPAGGVQAQELAILGSGSAGQVYLVTDEARDGRDWDADGTADDLVLLHWSESAGEVTYLATIESSTVHVVAIGDRAYFSEKLAVPPAPPETSLRYVEASQPKVKVVVNASDPASTGQVQHLLASDSGLLFLFQDEVAEARDFNGDGDQLDDHVLALLDATDPAAAVLNVGLAVRGDSSPVRALTKGPSSWLVAFLVNEAAQGDTNLNDPVLFSPGWQPQPCLGQGDTDTLDDVLHHLDFATWSTSPIGNPPTNTGLVGRDRVVALRTTGGVEFVGTISHEADEGTCSLNGDADTLDLVPRWVRVQVGVVLPYVNPNGLVAIQDMPGGTHGLSDLRSRWITVVDEAQDDFDHDGDGMKTHDLVAWLDPNVGAGATWVFDHGSALGMQSVGASWMAEREQRDRLLVAFQESVFGASINSGGDNDTLDSVPTFARFDPSAPSDLDFPGPAIAVAGANAGIAIANGVGFYRVDEMADNRDWNGVNGKNDFVLFRTTVATIQNSNFISTLSNIADRPAVETGGNVGVAFITDETMAKVDLNKDGDQDDLVVRWVRVGP